MQPTEPYIQKPGTAPKKPTPTSGYPGRRIYVPSGPPVTRHPYQPGVSYGCEIEINDPYVFRRAVGFYEYQRALQHLDHVGTHANHKQRKAIDQILGERLGYKISILVPGLNQNAAKIKQAGLPWMTALARVELGAMLAALTPNEKTFGRFPPLDFDKVQYKTLLVEGYRVHLNQIKNDKTLVPKPLTTNGNFALLQDQHLQLVIAWAQTMLALYGTAPDAQPIAEDLKTLQKIRTKLTSEFAARVQKVTGAPVIIYTEKIKK